MNEMRLSLIIGGSNDGAIKALSQVVARASAAGQSLRSLEVAGNFGKTRAGLTSISEQLARIQSAAVALGSIGFGVKGLGDLAKLSDSYVGSATRIKLATTASSEFAAAQAEVFAIAQRNGQALEATATLYARAARPIREMGRSQADALAVTDAVAASLKISNATTAESASAQLQFAQALGKGVVNGDELNAVLEASPRLAEALAAGLRVPVGALKELGAQGKLTSQAIVEALLAQREALAREAASMDQTIGQATTNLQNAFTKAFGENTSAGAVALARGINALAGNLDVLGQAAAVAGSAVLAVVGVRALTAVAAYTAGKVAAVAAERAAAQAALQTAQANVAAAAAQATHTLNTEALVRAKLQLAAAERTASLAAAGTGVRAGGALLGLSRQMK